MQKNKPYISVVVPIYNETLRLKKLYLIYTFLNNKKYKSEIIVVNDGSDDKTRKILAKIENNIKIKIIDYDKNMGKGYAVKVGMLESKGRCRFFMDIDLSVPIKYIDLFLEYADKYDVVIGSRRKKNSSVIEHQPIIRELLGKGYTYISQKLLGLPVSDFTCGFKYFNGEAANKIFKNAMISRWGFDSEVIYLVSFFKYKIYEAPVEWQNDSKTKVKFPNAIYSSIVELLTIKYNIIRGKYK